MIDSVSALLKAGRSPQLGSLVSIDNLALAAFLVLLLPFLLNAKLFLGKRGRVHRLLGALYLVVFCARAATLADVPFDSSRVSWRNYHVFMDTLLPLIGLVLTLAAAKAFPHKVRIPFSLATSPDTYTHSTQRTSEASGTLDSSELVSQDEMIEHAFYQFLNLCQIVYLNSEPSLASLMLVTLPWTVRSRFPVHPFSANYAVKRDKQTTTWMYFIKKWQYVFTNTRFSTD